MSQNSGDLFKQTSSDRAMNGIETLGLYSQIIEKQSDGMNTLVADLLCDLMHACSMEGVCFETCLRIANDHYGAEMSEV